MRINPGPILSALTGTLFAQWRQPMGPPPNPDSPPPPSPREWAILEAGKKSQKDPNAPMFTGLLTELFPFLQQKEGNQLSIPGQMTLTYTLPLDLVTATREQPYTMNAGCSENPTPYLRPFVLPPSIHIFPQQITVDGREEDRMGYLTALVRAFAADTPPVTAFISAKGLQMGEGAELNFEELLFSLQMPRPDAEGKFREVPAGSEEDSVRRNDLRFVVLLKKGRLLTLKESEHAYVLRVSFRNFSASANTETNERITLKAPLEPLPTANTEGTLTFTITP